MRLETRLQTVESDLLQATQQSPAFLQRFSLLLCVCVCCALMEVCVPGSFLEPGVIDGCDPPCGCWELNSGQPACPTSPAVLKQPFLCSLFKHYPPTVLCWALIDPKVLSLTQLTEPFANRPALSSATFTTTRTTFIAVTAHPSLPSSLQSETTNYRSCCVTLTHLPSARSQNLASQTPAFWQVFSV